VGPGVGAGTSHEAAGGEANPPRENVISARRPENKAQVNDDVPLPWHARAHAPKPDKRREKHSPCDQWLPPMDERRRKRKKKNG